MSTAVIGSLKAVLGLDTAQYDVGWSKAQKTMRDAGQDMQRLGGRMATIGAGFTATLTAPLIAAGFAASKAATEAADAMGQVQAALTSMGAASGKTKEELSALADGLMRNSLYDDDDILRAVTANMLTFGNVAGVNFDRAQQAAVDLATRMKMDLQPATLLIGKALNDPLKGLTAMGRAGIQFSDAQKEMIKSMVASGNVAGAQSIILNELQKQFGGAASAAQATDPYDRLRDSLSTLSESMGVIINRYITPLMDGVAAMADRFNALSPAMQNVVVIGAGIAAAIGPALIAVGALTGAVGTIVATFGAGGALAGAAALLGPIAIGVAAVAAGFLIFKDDIIPVLQSFGAALQEHVGPKLKPLFDALKGMIQQVGKAFAGFFSSETGSASKNLMAFGRIVAQVFGGVVDLITGAVNTITQVMRAIGAALNGDWSTMWNALGSAVAAMTHGVLEAFRTLFPGVLGSIKRMVDGVREELTRRLFDVLDGVIRKVRGVGEAFFKLYDAVVGHSYVPDMVEGIAAWMAKLDAGMVVPARNATEATKTAFEDLRSDVAAIMDGLLTDQERAYALFQREGGRLRAAAADGRFDPAMILEMQKRNQARYDEARTERLDPLPRTSLNPLTAGADLREALGVDRIKERIKDMRADFADAFADGLDAALRGDWTSVLRIMFGDTLRDLGSKVFDWLGKSGGGGGGGFGNIVSSIMSAFGGGLPKFAGGGSLLPSGMSAGDSQLTAFWKSPSERVDIYRPGQDMGASGPVRVLVEVNDDRFNAYVDGRAEPVAAAHSGAAFNGARRAVPAEMARSDRYRRK